MHILEWQTSASLERKQYGGYALCLVALLMLVCWIADNRQLPLLVPAQRVQQQALVLQRLSSSGRLRVGLAEGAVAVTLSDSASPLSLLLRACLRLA